MIKKIMGLFGVDSTSGPFTTNLKFTSGGTASADVNTLDAYVEGVFLPELTFGGASTGITYSSRGGVFTKIGNMVFFTLSIALSSKGSATGTQQITGLPYTVSATADFPSMPSLSSTPAAVDSDLVAMALATTTTINLYDYILGVRTRLTDADFTNTTIIRISGQYRVD